MVLDLAQNVFKSTVFGLFACALSAGCSKTVVLGSECPAQEGPCGDDTVRPPAESGSRDAGGAATGAYDGGFAAFDAAASDDGGIGIVADAAQQQPIDATQMPADTGTGQTTDSAQPPLDAEPDDAAESSGLLQNPSFELTANPDFGVIESQFGLDVLVSDLAGYIPRAEEFFASIDPWFACWVGAK